MVVTNQEGRVKGALLSLSFNWIKRHKLFRCTGVNRGGGYSRLEMYHNPIMPKVVKYRVD
jgi:hypothetical protein